MAEDEDCRNKSGYEATERDPISELELQQTRRIVYFSDGTLEMLTESESDPEDLSDGRLDASIDVSPLPLVVRLKQQVFQIGSGILAGIDFIGGGLANFFGITTPKFGSEVDFYKISTSHSEDWKVNSDSNKVFTSHPRSVISQYP